MSYILEALKKSEQERQIGHVPDVSMVQETAHRVAPRKPRWLMVALILNALILLAIAVWVWQLGAGHDNAVAPVVDSSAVDKRDFEVAVSRDSADPVSVPEPAPVTTPMVEPTPRTDPLPAPVSQMPLPAPKPTMKPAAILPDLEQSETEPVLPPRWQDLPLEERNNLPAPRIDVHVFAREPARRFVLINLRKYQEGDRVDEGATIESILADGIVLSYQGQRYRVDRP